MFWKFLGRIFPQNSALSSLVASLYDIRVTRQSSKILSAEKRFFSFSVSTLLFFYRSGWPSCTGGRTLCRHFFYFCGSGKCTLLSLYSQCAGACEGLVFVMCDWPRSREPHFLEPTIKNAGFGRQNLVCENCTVQKFKKAELYINGRRYFSSVSVLLHG